MRFDEQNRMIGTLANDEKLVIKGSYKVFMVLVFTMIILGFASLLMFAFAHEDNSKFLYDNKVLFGLLALILIPCAIITSLIVDKCYKENRKIVRKDKKDKYHR